MTAKAVLGCVIIPAHDEAAVITRVIGPLAELAASGRIELVVAANGCHDDTVSIASRFEGVRVLDLPNPSKPAAMREADREATSWPRVYLDADVECPATSLIAVLELLGADGAILAARPAFRYETVGASTTVRSYYRARGRIPALNAAMWGAGVYALSRRGHERLGEFPDATADDLVIDRLFSPEEKRVLSVEPVIVRTPRTTSALLATLRRVRSGNGEQGVDSGGSTLGGLIRSIRGLRSAIDACVYLLISARARLRSSAPTSRWERDDTSRT